uniref:uncharacterized protein LOC105351519 n=1 Tax=Fragaria vesca subsp. vesca TaxID=101020 RepID=UPI0005C8DDC5|nr:PREDICTED: uncharacterized protein LOC105351519 [Fragaria vesca subsp. vesca]
MEVENIGIPVILEDLKVICEDGRRNSISVIPQEKEPTVSHIRRHSIALVPQEMESKGGDIINNSIPVIQQAIEPNGDEIGRKSIPVIPQETVSDGDDSRIPMIPQEVESKGDESDDINTDSIPVIPQELESNVDESNDVIPVTPQEMELEGSDVGRNSIPETMQEIELDGDDIQANSIPVILHEMDSGDLRRNSIACTPQEMEPEGGDIKRNSIIVIPAGIEANDADVRRRSIARSIQSRYLRASLGSCHDYCKYGKDENLEASPKAERKRTFTTNSKPSPDSFVTEKRVISVTKKGTLKKVSSFKEVDVPMEDSIHSRVKRRQFEPSSKVKSTASHEPSPDSEAQILNKSFVTEKNVVLVTEKINVSLEKEIDVTMEDSMDLEEEQPELTEPSSLTGSVHSMMNSKVVSRNSSKPSQDSETWKLNDSAVMEKKAISVKKKDTGSSKNEMPSFVSMVEQGSHHKGNIGTRKSKEAADSSSSGGNRSIRNHNRRASLSGEKQTMGMQTVSLSSKHFNKRDSNVNPGRSYNLKGFSHVKDPNDPGKVEPEPPSDKDMPEKILYVIESSTENNTVDSTPDGVSVPKPSPLSPVSVEGKSKNNTLERARKGIGRIGSFPSFEKKHLKRVDVAHCLSAAPLDQDNKGLRCTRHGTQESLSPSLSSSSMSISLPKSTHDKLNGANSQHGTSKTVEPIGKSKVQHKTTPRRSAIVGCGNQNSVSRKLSFRRGRVIELQPENITPRRLKFRRASSALEVQNSKDSITSGSIGKKDVDDSESTGAAIIKRGSNVRKEVDDRQSNAAGIIKRGSIVRKEVGDRQSNGVAIKREIIGKKKVDDQTNGAGIKRVSILKKELGDRQPNGVSVKRAITGSMEVDDNQTNGAKLKSVKVGLRNQEKVEVSPRKVLRRKGDSVDLSNGIRSNSEKVVLRHQDVKGKKDDQKLLNNVIEETAIKLVETRKSKVKALVGAFETVISLQDTRPAAKTGAC